MNDTGSKVCMGVSSGIHAYYDDGYGLSCIHCSQPSQEKACIHGHICGEQGETRLHADHDHATGFMRGLSDPSLDEDSFQMKENK